MTTLTPQCLSSGPVRQAPTAPPSGPMAPPMPGGGRRVTPLLAALLAAFAGPVLALPEGGQIVAGQGVMTRDTGARTLTVTQQTPNLAIHWQGFNIGGNEAVTFMQPGTGAIALNRVLGATASQIDGRLLANGQVWVLNPNGVVFGAGAQVSVGGLIASTLDLNTSDFLGGTRTFSGTAGSVTNRGLLKSRDGGYIALLGGRVSNEGIIRARLGTAALAAGQQITLSFTGDQLLGVQVERGLFNTLVDNQQLIQADGGRVIMTTRAADAVFGGVVNNSGVVEAQTIDNTTGTIRLLAGNNGGSVQQNGTLDASAPFGSGNGGLIETSAAQVNVPDGALITTEAPWGTTGQWLMDPTNFTIAPVNGDMTGAALAARLARNNVTLLSTQGRRSGPGDIRVFDSVTWGSRNSLTLSALRNVVVARPIRNNGSGDITLRADNTGACVAGSASCGTVRFVEQGSIRVNGGDVAIFYNPPGSRRAANDDGNGPSYASPTDFRGFVSLNNGSTLNAWMLVNDVNQLQAMRTHRNGDYALGRAINASDSAGWNDGAGFQPIAAFGGRFEGANRLIYGLTINRPDDNGIGLFGQITGAGRADHVRLAAARISGLNNVGALAGENLGTVTDSTTTSGRVSGLGEVGGLIGSNAGRLTGSSASGTVTGRLNVGGLAGQNLGLIRTGQARGTVTGILPGGGQVGGLVGDNAGTIVDGHASTTVRGTGRVGGLAGINEGTIRQSDAAGTATGDDSVGGLVGYNTAGASIVASRSRVSVIGGEGSAFGGLVGLNNGTLASSFATGNVRGDTYVGGLVGIHFGRLRDSYALGSVSGNEAVGGLAGYNAGRIASSYSNGRVSGDSEVGGLIGNNASGLVSRAYWNTQRAGVPDAVGDGDTAGITGLTSAQMRREASFRGFDFTRTWDIVEGVTTPFLIPR